MAACCSGSFATTAAAAVGLGIQIRMLNCVFIEIRIVIYLLNILDIMYTK